MRGVSTGIDMGSLVRRAGGLTIEAGGGTVIMTEMAGAGWSSVLKRPSLLLTGATRANQPHEQALCPTVMIMNPQKKTT